MVIIACLIALICVVLLVIYRLEINYYINLLENLARNSEEQEEDFKELEELARGRSKGYLKNVKIQQLLQFAEGQNVRLNFPLPSLRRLAKVTVRLFSAKRNELQAQITHKQQLEEQITHISHDLRTPLTALAGYLELLFETKDVAEQERYKSIIWRRITSLQDLIADFYALTRVESPALMLNSEFCKIDNLLSEALLSFYEDFNQCNIQMKVELEQAPAVLAEKKSLCRIYANILQNILRYGDQEASIWHGQNLPEELKQALLKADKLPEKAPQYTVFRNKIKESYLKQEIDYERIFERLFSGDLSRSNNRSASGLGLYIVKLLLTQQGFGIVSLKVADELFLVISY